MKKTPTERTWPLEAANDARRWLQVTLSSIGDAVITTDGHAAITFMNPVAESLTGWSQDEAAGKGLEQVFRIVNEETRKTVESPTTRALREGVVVGLANHTLLIAKDGSERPIDDSAAPIRNDEGQVAGVVLVFRDITERRREERRVTDSLAYAQAVLATLRHKFLVLGSDLRVKSANANFYRTFQVSEEETVGRSIYDLGRGQWNIPRLRTLLEEILPLKNSFEDFEVAHEFPRVGHRILMLNARQLQQDGGSDGLILLSMEDITERRTAEAIIHESEVRYRRLFQTAKDGILILDAGSGKIIDANAFMVGLLGGEPSDLIGKELWEIGLFADIQENKEAFKELQEKGYLRYDHLPVRNQRGETVEVEFVSNVYQEDHRHVAQCNVRDISQRARMERQIKEQAEELADQSRRKDDFLAMLSHELRNPLAPIRNATYVLKLQEPGAENLIQQQAREIIERQVAQLTRLVSDLLDVSRIRTGRIRMTPAPVDMNQVVHHALETASPLIDPHHHDVVMTLPGVPVWVNADATRLEEVVVNLLGNAAKYTDDGGRIEVSLELGSDHALLRVRDSGIGIAPELLPHIFDLFTQADRSLDRAQGGLGIGLSLVKRIAELHGGTAEADSAGPGQGSEFRVRLPLIPGPEQSPPEPAETHHAHKHQRVLVVDDNVDSIVMLAHLLRLQGYGVRTAHTGSVALKLAMEWRPDVVLLDIGLPEIDGYEIARRIRLEPGLKDILLIAMTGYGRDSDVQLAREAGFDQHLLKPVDPARLQELLDR
jgi:PAS domain S-box-containing protein